jgi:predicted nucleic acid-binding protein
MTTYFLDSSALVKRYVDEIGSPWIQAQTEPTAGHILVVSRITYVEIFSAFARLQREGVLSARDLDGAIDAFQFDWETQYQIVEIDYALTQVASRLLLRHLLRAYDSVQLATGLKLLPTFKRRELADDYLFVSADTRLLKAARAEGLETANPIDQNL